MRPFIRLLLLLAVAGPALGQATLPLEFRADPGWEAQPGYLANPAQNPRVEVRDGAVELSIAEPGKGMKFRLALAPFDCSAADYLLLRYRASNLGPGYALWAMSGSGPGREWINTADLKCDGEWHTLALDLVGLQESGMLHALLTEVQCQGPPARIAFASLVPADEVPAGADVWPPTRPEEPELVVRAAALPVPKAQPTWLLNPTSQATARHRDGLLHLRVAGAGKGMKWAAPLSELPDLSPYRYVTVRYRARGFEKGGGDYFIWLANEVGGQAPRFAQPVRLPDVVDDDQWLTAVFPLEAPFQPREIAFQVQSKGASAEAWIDTLRFTSSRPIIPLAEVLPLTEGHAATRLPAKQACLVDLTPVANDRAEPRLRRLGFSSWPAAERITVRGIPFRLARGERNILATPRDIDQVATVPLQGKASEVYLLLAARLPALDLARMGDGLPLRSFENPERFVVRLTYQDGVTDEIFPIRLGSGKHEVIPGVDVYCVPVPRGATLRRLTLRNRMNAGRFLLGGVTLNTGKALTPRPVVAGLPPAAAARPMAPGAGRIQKRLGGFLVANNLLSLDLQTVNGIGLRAAENHCLRGGKMRIEPGPLFTVGIGEKLVPSTRVRTGSAVVRRQGQRQTLTVPVDATAAGVPLKGEFVCRVGEGADILFDLRLKVTGSQIVQPVVHFPTVSGVVLGSVEDTWYLWCRKGGLINRVPHFEWGYYGGQYPLQVADFFNPALGGGLSLATYDLKNIYKSWAMAKQENGGLWRIEYTPREYRPGEQLEIAPTALRAHSGDWRAALSEYRRWVSTWYRPQVPRKPWFLKAFNYRQHWAWGNDLRNEQTGQWRIEEVIAADREFFGCLDYLHIFDFGESRVYGRVGDYCHYEELGGREAMAAAIERAKQLGVPVGVYIEGYLCDIRAQWGRDNVLRYAIQTAKGEPLLYSPGGSEYMMCPATKEWRDHLAATYQRVAGEIRPSGMYIDQLGFLDAWKTCHSREHGHLVPAYPNRGEAALLQAIRAAVPPGIPTLTEETPCDVNSQYSDGALGYSVTWANPELAPHRVDLFRFLFPDFKVFQLVSYNDFVEGGWHLLKWPFFNGEGTWLHNPITTGFSTDARDFLRQAFAILNRYEDAFASSDVEPLVPTRRPTLYANRFSGKRHTVWTFFNADYTTARGELLRLPASQGGRFHDAFTGKPIRPRREGNWLLVPLTIGPRDVGCLVRE